MTPTDSREISKLALASRAFGIAGACIEIIPVACIGFISLDNFIYYATILFLGFGCGITAVICGHSAVRNIRRPVKHLKGRGIAIAGLIPGYAAFLIPLAFLLVLPMLSASATRARLLNKEDNGVEIAGAILDLAHKPATNGHGSLGLPADIGIATAGDFTKILTLKEGFTGAVIKRLHVKDFLIGNTRTSDPPTTILLRTTPEASKAGVVVIRVNGVHQIYENPDMPPQGDPPRNPPYLKQ